MNLFLVVLGALKIIFLIGFLVFIHEGCHFLVAKKMGVKVLEFSLGFGKKIWSKQGKETEYNIRRIPLGGFVRMLGENEEVDDERAFQNASVGKRLLIVFAGPVINIVFGLFLFWILASLYNHNAYYGWIVMKRYVVAMAQGIGSLFTGGAKEAELIGPVGISSLIAKTDGWFDFFYYMSVISVSLGVTNLLPIPGLDGGKILLLLVEGVRRKKISQNTELTLTAFRNAIIINDCYIRDSKRYWKTILNVQEAKDEERERIIEN